MTLDTNVLQSNDVDETKGVVQEHGSKGRVVLAPIQGSVERAALRLELDLTRGDGVLVLGDLRIAAEQQSSAGHHEAAHRLWAIVHTAAARIGHDYLVARSIAMGDGSLLKLRTEARAEHKAASRATAAQPDSRPSPSATPRGVSYDYVSLAADCDSGMTQRETATKWDCSTTTVSRAVRYVATLNSLLETSPQLKEMIHSGKSVNDLASEFEVETKVMRWIVSNYWDRRN